MEETLTVAQEENEFALGKKKQYLNAFLFSAQKSFDSKDNFKKLKILFYQRKSVQRELDRKHPENSIVKT